MGEKRELFGTPIEALLSSAEALDPGPTSVQADVYGTDDYVVKALTGDCTDTVDENLALLDAANAEHGVPLTYPETTYTVGAAPQEGFDKSTTFVGQPRQDRTADVLLQEDGETFLDRIYNVIDAAAAADLYIDASVSNFVETADGDLCTVDVQDAMSIYETRRDSRRAMEQRLHASLAVLDDWYGVDAAQYVPAD